MSDDLRGPLVVGVERLAGDLAVGRFGDPHVGFVVFVSPDGAPSIAVISKGTTTGFEHVQVGVPKDGCSERTAWSWADLEEAAHGLSDAYHGAQNRRWRPDPERPLSADVDETWSRRREVELARQVKTTEQAIRYAARCEFCGGRYTTRGLAQHQARSVYCARRKAEIEAAAL